MSYSPSSRVVHVNEVAQVGSALVRQARSDGKSWALRPIPPGRGKPSQVIHKRLGDFVDWSRQRLKADLVDVHFATNGYYGWGSQPFVLHLHGTDIRRDWQSPILHPVIEHSLRRADAVVCATPDLLGWVSALRPDAQWLPNPVPASFFTPNSTRPRPGRVLFSSRWDDTKGVDVLLPLAANLIASGLQVIGLNWGPLAHAASDAGVHLYDYMSPVEFANLIASSEVVVGQLEFPTLSMTDYQTLALGRPLVAAASMEDAPIVAVDTLSSPTSRGSDIAHSKLPDQPVPRCPDAIAHQIRQICTGNHHLSPKHTAPPVLRKWVEGAHHPRAAVQTLEEVYRRVLA